MAIETKPLFHPEVLRREARSFALPDHLAARQARLEHWADLIESGRADTFKETDLLPDFLADLFCGVLGYTRPVGPSAAFTLAREHHVQVDGKFADAVLGRFGAGEPRFVVALEGKGTRDPLDRPFAGRRMSAVDQAYRYAINLPCDWILVTSMRETRLYHKGSNQQTFERFETVRLAREPARLKRFVFLLGAERVVPEKGDCHLDALLKASQTADRELTNRFYALYADIRRQMLDRLCRENPAAPAAEVLRCAQKLLDRVLFCAFCEDRELLPAETLKRAFQHHDPYNPRPIWENFRGLFRSIDTGNAGLNIPAYNGGLFAPDPALDALTVPDEVCESFKRLGEYDYRPARAVADDDPPDATTTVRQVIDVDILGHIFEQSITDLERLRQELEDAAPLNRPPGTFSPTGGEGEASAAPSDSLAPIGGKGRGEGASVAGNKKARSRRKQEGAFYTPPFITRYIVEQALGGVLKTRFEALRARHESAAEHTARKTLADPNAYDLAALNEPQRRTLIRFWEAWQEELKQLRLLDPACGSGAFLIEAFDQLHAVYEDSNARLEELRGQRTLFDLDRQILQHNLYGVDLNPEAVQICQLSLWIKTAARGKQLTSLDHNIREGNSVISDPAVHPRAFAWEAAFPEVFAAGGFDVVVGNPPYIRQEMLAPFKSYWEGRFESYHGVADIFAYFFEQGIEVLRPGGRLAFITSGSWVRGNFGTPLRGFLSSHARVESLVDFGEFQPFEDAEMIRPSIIVLRKDKPGGEMRLFKWLTTGRPPETLSEEIALAPTVQSNRFGEPAWDLESDEVLDLLAKLSVSHPTLHTSTGGRILYGLKTGLTDAFVVGQAIRDQLLAGDPSCERFIRPFVQGTHLRPWYAEEDQQYLIALRSSANFQWPWSDKGRDAEQAFRKTYPSVFDHLDQFRDAAIKRTDQGTFWWELRSCDYWDAFDGPKIVWPDISKLPRFSLESTGRYMGNTGYFIPTSDLYLLGILSSWATWFFISKTSQPLRLRGDRWQYRLFTQSTERIPIPGVPAAKREIVAELARTCGALAQERYRGEVHFQQRMIQCFDADCAGTLNQKAQSWWTLSLNQLGDALKTSFKLKASPMKKPQVADEWEPYLAQRQQEHARLSTRLSDAEAELNDRVYHLFDLTPDEIRLLQREVEH